MTETVFENSQILTEENKTEFYEDITNGLKLFNKNENIEALDYFQKLTQKWSEQPEIFFALGVLSFEMNRRGHAISFFEKAHQMDGNCKDYSDALAYTLTSAGKLSDGLYYAKLSMTQDPHPHFKPFCPPKLSNYALALQKTAPSKNYLNGFIAFKNGDYKNAISLCNSELQLNPKNADCLHLLAKLQIEIGDYHNALQCMRSLSHLREDINDQALLLKALVSSGNFDQAKPLAIKLADKSWKEPNVLNSLRFALPILGEEKKLKAIVNKWEKKYCVNREENKREPFDPKTRNKVRIGFLCNFGFGSDKARSLLNLIRNINSSRFEIVLYVTAGHSDNFTSTLKASVSEVRQLENIDGFTASLSIGHDTLDILIDASSNPDETHYEIMAQRPAPVQISWHGENSPYSAIGTDYVLSDIITKDIDEKFLLPHQKQVTLNNSLFSVSPFANYPDTKIDPKIKEGEIIFGAQFAPNRITPELISDWSEILSNTPNSYLIFGNGPTHCHETQMKIVSMFGNYGLANRIRFYKYEDSDFSQSGQLINKEFFTEIDIFLDTYIVSGQFEIAEALWMGIPVITLTGKNRESLASASILNAARHFEWATKSRKDYIKKASAMAGNGESLFTLREKLRNELLSSPLFSPRIFAQDMENAFWSILYR